MLKGEYIYLQGVEMGDLELIDRLENDPTNWLNSGTLIPFSKKSLEDYVLSIRDLSSDKQCRWIIRKTEDNSSIGAVDLFEYDAVHRRAGIGIIIEKESREKGFASEAIAMICEYAFSHLNLYQVWANIIDSNKVSLHLFEKAGFVKMGTKNNWILNNGNWYHEHLYQKVNPKF